MSRNIMYVFYYDESQHSRRITYETITSSNYYDNFSAIVVGWSKEKEISVFKKYSTFVEKYKHRKREGEFKSTTLKPSQFKNGLASLNKENTRFITDFLSIFDKDFKLYIFVSSKIEYLVLQMFRDYENNLLFDADSFKYTITKAILTYRPERVIKSIYYDNENLLDSLKDFFNERVNLNKKNMKLKELETKAFKEALIYLNKISFISALDWGYSPCFDGFKKYIKELGISNYILTIDKEGDTKKESKTLKSAKSIGLTANETDSKASFGLQISDIMVGIISKLMKALHDSLRYHSPEEELHKQLLNNEWFNVNQEQLGIYKTLYKIFCIWDHAWYKSYAGIYADDLIILISLFDYFNRFKNVDEITMNNKNHSESFNSLVNQYLLEHFNRLRNKLNVDIINKKENDEYFLNSRGGKVYYDINKQPVVSFFEGSQCLYVLSVGMHNSGAPLITVLINKKPVCYRLPAQLIERANTLIAFANRGEFLFPSYVVFNKENEDIFVDIL